MEASLEIKCNKKKEEGKKENEELRGEEPTGRLSQQERKIKQIVTHTDLGGFMVVNERQLVHPV